MEGETILQEAQRLVYGERNADYGHPADDFAKTAKIWTGILLPKLQAGVEISPQEVGFCMCGVKLSREVENHRRDNLVDLAGYAATVQMIEDRGEEVVEMVREANGAIEHMGDDA
ncbi:MAG TPA: DUF6378 domain-containing protein [Phycisphaerae bacterium]|nr:DUF6378 domain-containing protein [Phycisphaerae bacterium]